MYDAQERKDELEKQIQQLREQTKESEQDSAMLEEKDRSVRFLEKENLQLMMDLKLANHDLMRVRAFQPFLLTGPIFYLPLP